MNQVVFFAEQVLVHVSGLVIFVLHNMTDIKQSISNRPEQDHAVASWALDACVKTVKLSLKNMYLQHKQELLILDDPYSLDFLDFLQRRVNV